jgi:type I restriction enzyme S subunit
MTGTKQRLDTVAEILMGQAPPGEAYNSEGEGWPLLAGAGDFRNGRPAAKKFTREAARICKTGDIIIGVRASIGEKVIADRQYCLGRGVAALRARPAVHDRYLWHWLSSTRQKLEGKGKGATFKQVTKEDLAELEILLPPMEEQRRIAAILDKAAHISANQARAEDLRLAVKRSLFEDSFHLNGQTAVTIGAELPLHWKGWEWRLLTDVARLATGHTPDRGNKAYWGGDIPWITLGDIRQLDGRLAYHTKEMTTNEGIVNSSAVLLPKGTVCFSRTASVGFSTVMGKEMSTSQDFVNWVCGPDLLPEYLMHALIFSRARLKGLSTGSTHKTIYFSTVEQLRVLLPPISVQAMFCELIRKVDLMQLSESRELINRLKQSLAAELF